jgi:hypothetical protein
MPAPVALPQIPVFYAYDGLAVSLTTCSDAEFQTVKRSSLSMKSRIPFGKRTASKNMDEKNTELLSFLSSLVHGHLVHTARYFGADARCEPAGQPATDN